MQNVPFDPLSYHPLALILGSEVFARITLPDPPPFDLLTAQATQVRAALKPEERKQILARARWLGAYASALEAALGKG